MLSIYTRIRQPEALRMCESWAFTSAREDEGFLQCPYVGYAGTKPRRCRRAPVRAASPQTFTCFTSILCESIVLMIVMSLSLRGWRARVRSRFLSWTSWSLGEIGDSVRASRLAGYNHPIDGLSSLEAVYFTRPDLVACRFPALMDSGDCLLKLLSGVERP